MVRMGAIGRLVAGAGFLALSALPSQAYTAFNIFGDSLSDLGNFSLTSSKILSISVPVSPPYDDGRFSNGPIWIEDLATKLSLGPLAPSLAKGSDYAYGSATASRAIPNTQPFATLIPTATDQVDEFLDRYTIADPGALYSMWIGSNDVIDALDDKLDKTVAKPLLKISAQAEADAILTLAKAGARDILVGLVPDLSVVPVYNTAAGSTKQNAYEFAQYYNDQLKADLGPAASMAHIFMFDTFRLLDDAVRMPASYGFTNVTNACYTGSYFGGGSVCGDEAGRLFWDQVHPTTTGHEAVAALASAALASGPITAVPLPAAAPLFGAALAVLGLAHRRQRQKQDKATV